MKCTTHSLEFITPCFCAGANQGKAEVRAASIRGELRWWFRVLGGTQGQEREVFGEITKAGAKGSPTTSKIVVRTEVTQALHDESDLPGRKMGQPLFYLGYFIAVSGEQKGQRLQPDAFFSKKTSFKLHLVERGILSVSCRSLYTQAIRCLLKLGSVGMRTTRGFGAWHDGNDLTEKKFTDWLKDQRGLNAWWLPRAENARKAHIRLEKFLKDFRKSMHFSGKRTTAVGGANPRQTSTLHLRPVKVREGVLPVVFYAEYPLADNLPPIRRKLSEYFAARF